MILSHDHGPCRFKNHNSPLNKYSISIKISMQTPMNISPKMVMWLCIPVLWRKQSHCSMLHSLWHFRWVLKLEGSQNRKRRSITLKCLMASEDMDLALTMVSVLFGGFGHGFGHGFGWPFHPWFGGGWGFGAFHGLKDAPQGYG